MHRVSKTFSFCYGHRLLNDPGKCGGLHGHTAKATITLARDALDDAGMVCHFDELKKKVGCWIEETLDHAMILAADDPLAGVLKKAGERVLVIDDNPTAENLAKLIYTHAAEVNFPVIEVELWESPTSKATYVK